MTGFLAVLDRLTKGAILIGWIALLFFLGMHALEQNARGMLETHLSWALPRPTLVVPQTAAAGSSVGAQPIALLRQHLAERHAADPPPMSTILEALIPKPRWVDHPKFTQFIGDTELATLDVEQEYSDLFRRISDELDAIIADRDVAARDATLEPSVLGGIFTVVARDDATPLPKRATIWVERQREFIDAEAKLRELENTFLLVIVLGAFGSLIFLVRTFVIREKEAKLTISAYLFRPILGLLLAMALFLIDLLVQTVVSTADVTEVRSEPLLMLALAAGLLSEQAYELVHSRAEALLARYRKSPEEAEE